MWTKEESNIHPASVYGLPPSAVAPNKWCGQIVGGPVWSLLPAVNNGATKQGLPSFELCNVQHLMKITELEMCMLTNYFLSLSSPCPFTCPCLIPSPYHNLVTCQPSLHSQLLSPLPPFPSPQGFLNQSTTRMGNRVAERQPSTLLWLLLVPTFQHDT